MEPHLIRPIKTTEGLKKEIYILRDVIKIGSSNIADIIIDDLLPLHFTIKKSGPEMYSITEVIGKFFFNGTEVKPGRCDIKLQDKCCMICGDRIKGVPLIYRRDEVASENKKKDFGLQYLNATSCFGISKSISLLDKIKIFCDGIIATSETEFAKYIATFLVKNFPIQRCLIFKVIDESKWIPIFGIAPEESFFPSMTLLKELKKTKQTILFNYKDSTNFDKSLSIVQQQVAQALVFPILKNNTLISVIYIDTILEKQTLSSEDFTNLTALIPIIAYVIGTIEKKLSIPK